MSRRIGRRNRTRQDVLAKRKADDERRANTKPARQLMVPKDCPPTILYNPRKLRQGRATPAQQLRDS